MTREKVMHWADQTAKRIVQQRGKKAKYVLAAGITPSGTIHLGNFREIITVDLIDKAMKDLGHKTRFLYSWDEYDVFRKVPTNMPNQDMLKKHLRRSITDIPDPFDCKHESYARHNEKEVEKELPDLNIAPEFIYQADKYKKSAYAEEMKTALENTGKIKEILNEHRTDPLEDSWLPVAIFCEKCGKDTTKYIEYHGDYNLTYECDCGHKDTFDFRKKGIAKLKWRVDWPARWKYEKVDFESGGKDHFAAGGSFQTGEKILQEVFGQERFASMRYEWISMKGFGQFASSKGLVITLAEMKEIYEPTIIRWLFASTRPDTEFAISFDLDVLSIYEEFDRCERIYFKKEETDEKNYAKQKRIYELSAVKIPKKIPYQPGLRHLTSVLQTHEKDLKKTKDEFKKFLKTKEDKERFEIRLNCALNWLEKYAPEDFKFTVQKEVPKGLKLGAKEKQGLKKVADVLDKVKTDKELHDEFYKICEELKLNTAEFFKAAYMVLVNKERGPRLASFILTIGKSKVKKLFESV